jgi:hypothetical protein
MTYRIITARPMFACDTFGGIPSASAAVALARDFGAVGLYPGAGNCEASLAYATGAGMGVWFILEGLEETTMPSAQVGASLASHAVGLISGWGVPQGYTLATDMEGPQPNAHDGWIALADVAADVVQRAHSLSMAYAGFGVGLTSQEWYRLKCTRYYKSGSQVKDRFGAFAEPECGWAVVQGQPFNVWHSSGVVLDYDSLYEDYQGRAITLVVSGD